MKNISSFYQKSWFIIFMIIFFFPIGLILMWRYSSWSLKVKTVISSIFVLILAINISSPSKSPDSPVAEQIETSDSSKSEASPQETKHALEQKIQTAIKNSILCEFQSIDINSFDENANYLVINLKAKPGYDKESTLVDFNETAKYIFKEVYTANLPFKVNNCKIIFNSKLTNSKTGEESNEGIYAISLDNSAADQIHWDKIDNIDISLSVNDRYLHPAFNAMK